MVVDVNIPEGAIFGPFTTALIKQQLGDQPTTRQVANLLRQSATIGSAMRQHSQIVVTPEAASHLGGESMVASTRYRFRHRPEIHIELCRYLSNPLPEENVAETYLYLAEVYAAAQFGALQFGRSISRIEEAASAPAVTRDVANTQADDVASLSDTQDTENSSAGRNAKADKAMPESKLDAPVMDPYGPSKEGDQSSVVTPNAQESPVTGNRISPKNDGEKSLHESENSSATVHHWEDSSRDSHEALVAENADDPTDKTGETLQDNKVHKGQDDDEAIEDDWLKELGGGGEI
ncbi:hypothetical protein [Halomonas sp. I5-271120]|uniref:hypothetical protein n=1 Tax=Halomonas sp. I5-271120 TaxID=3061632 RepID=UPI0027146C57|nr:hypothetical protein [Halomonas sp. I5-271120]